MKYRLMHFIGFICLAVPLYVSAQTEYPTKPITLVVPFSPGGGSDIVAIILSEKLGPLLKQPIVVDNRPGAGGTLAARMVAKASPDGYTLLLADTPFTANITVYQQPGYSASDFIPIATIATVSTLIVVSKRLGVNSVSELIAYAKKNPGKLNMASGGNGGVAHLAAARFAQATGVEWTHIPYKGMSQALIDVVGGQADVIFVTAPTAMPHLNDGLIKALAINSATRSRFMPDIPTIKELGYPQLVSDNWYGVVAPKGTPQNIVKKLHDETNQILKSKDTVSSLEKIMAVPYATNTPNDFEKLIDEEVTVWRKTVKAAKIDASN